MIYDGIILVDKDFGLSSFEVVSKVRRLLQVRKAGHTGTLDPQATGLLLIAIGKATKLSGYLSNQRKRYLAKIRLGQSRDTFDRFGSITDEKELNLSVEDIEGAISGLKGDFEQIIPPYSAAHYNGQRRYKLARDGVEIPAKYRSVQIYYIKMLGYDSPLITIDIECSSGTYIRSIAHQMGEKFGCGAHLYSLRRISIGDICVDNALTIRQLDALLKLKHLNGNIIPIHKILKIPSLTIDDSECAAVLHGQDILQESIYRMDNDFQPGDLIGIKNRTGELLAIGQARFSSEYMRQKNAGTTKIFDYKRVI